jgi:hypothetical protein
MTDIYVEISGRGDLSFTVTWPEGSPLPRVGESIELDTDGVGFVMNLVSLTHQVEQGSPRIAILVSAEIDSSYGFEEVVKTLQEHPLVTESFLSGNF